MFVYKVILCYVSALCLARNVYSAGQHVTGATLSGSPFDILLNKMETFQDKLTESDQKLDELSETIDQKPAALQTKTESAVKEHPDYIDGQYATGDVRSCVTVEMLLNKLETLQSKLIESDQKLIWLSETIDHKLAVLQTETKAAMQEHRDYIGQQRGVQGNCQTDLGDPTSRPNETMDLSKEILRAMDQLGKKFTDLQARSCSTFQQNQEAIDQKLVGVNGSIKQLDQSLTTLNSQTSVMLKEYQESTDRKLNQFVQTLDDKFKALQAQSNKIELAANEAYELLKIEIQTLTLNKTFMNKVNSEIISIPSCKCNLPKGKYLIVPNKNIPSFLGFCDDSVLGGGWLVFQYRFNGSVDFYRNWEDYREGFGSLDGEFWLGLEQLHQLTSARKYELLVEMTDNSGVYVYARYKEFEIGSEADKYALKRLGSYSGTAGDALYMHKDNKFSTWDQDNDSCSAYHCADRFGGAWWHNCCAGANLNGKFKNGEKNSTGSNAKYMAWYRFRASINSMTFTRMSIREI